VDRTSCRSRIAEIWRQPDQELWESRGGAKQYVYSKVMAWVAVDRFVKMQGAPSKTPPASYERLLKLRDEMHAEICRKGFNE